MSVVRTWVVVVWLSLLPVAHASEAALEGLSREVAERVVALDCAVEACDARKRSAPPAALQRDRLVTLGIEREAVMGAVMYLGQRNDYRCARQPLADLLLASTLLDNARKAYGQPPLGYPDTLAALTQPNVRYFELEAAYGRLSPDARAYLATQYGETPFDALAAIKGLPEY